MKKDIFIDNNIASKFSNPQDPEYIKLTQWLMYFDSKEAILRTVCYDMLEFAEVAKGLIASAEGTPQQKLVTSMKIHIELLRTHTYSSTVYLHDWRYMTNPEDFKGFKAHKESYEILFSNILSDGMKSGDFKITDHAHALINLVVAGGAVAAAIDIATSERLT